LNGDAMADIPSSNKIEPQRRSSRNHLFDVQAFLATAGAFRKIIEFRKSQKIYSQGDPAASVMYVQKGNVKLSVVNEVGKEAVLAILQPGDFFGEGGMAGQLVRKGTATAITPTTLLVIEKDEMIRVLHVEHAFSDRFASYMLSRMNRIEEDLTDQLFNSTEKRLARTLLLLAHYGKNSPVQKTIPKISQQMLAEMIGTSRSRVNFFMNKFKKQGFIYYKGGLQVHNSLLSVILHE
jgi:CRP/FNR family transcriptional regulator, cyclic AMP receptor protein